MPDVSHNFEAGAWKFTPEVAKVFDQHVAANLPNYQLIQDLVTYLSDWLAPSGSLIADIGASTGTSARLISDRHPSRSLTFALYDVEKPMLDLAKSKLSGIPANHRVTYNTFDVRKRLEHEAADLTLALFTLQFLPVHDRGPLLVRLAELARPETGYLIVGEKVEQDEPLWQEISNEATWDYKAQCGVDSDTIRTKARSLRGVLQPLRADSLATLIASNGWEAPVCLFRWHGWGIWVARVRTEVNG